MSQNKQRHTSGGRSRKRISKNQIDKKMNKKNGRRKSEKNVLKQLKSVGRQRKLPKR